MDSAIGRINHYPLDNSNCFASVYQLDSDYPVDSVIHRHDRLNNWPQDVFLISRSLSFRRLLLHSSNERRRISSSSTILETWLVAFSSEFFFFLELTALACLLVACLYNNCELRYAYAYIAPV